MGHAGRREAGNVVHRSFEPRDQLLLGTRPFVSLYANDRTVSARGLLLPIGFDLAEYAAAPPGIKPSAATRGAQMSAGN